MISAVILTGCNLFWIVMDTLLMSIYFSNILFRIILLDMLIKVWLALVSLKYCSGGDCT